MKKPVAGQKKRARITTEDALEPLEKQVLEAIRTAGLSKAPDAGGLLPGDAVRFMIEEINGETGGSRIFSLCGWTIDGDIDLKGRTGLGNLSFENCDIRGKLVLEFAELRALDLDGAKVDALDAMRARIRGSVYMRWGFHARHGVDLSGAWIEGSLTCRGATMGHDPKPSEAKDPATVFPNEKARRPGQKPVAAGASDFEDPFCLKLRHTTVGGTLYLGPKHANEDRLWEASQDSKSRGGRTLLEGSVDLSGLRVREFVDHKHTYEHMRLHGHRIVLDGFEYDRFGGCSSQDWKFRVRKWLSLQPNTFPPEPDFLAWLRGWGVTDREFHPQPYEQLARVLKVMGHDRDAKEVQFRRRRNQTLHSLASGQAPEKQTEKQEKPKAAWDVARAYASAVRNEARRVAGWVFVTGYGLVTGFGYKALNLLGAIGAVVFACTLLMSQASNVGLVAPANLMAADSAWWRDCRSQNQAANGLVAQIVQGPEVLNACLKRDGVARPDRTSQGHFEEYPTFNPLFFAIESFFPVLDLGQKQYWMISDRTPQGSRLDMLLAFYTMLGWVGTSLLIAGLFARFNQRGAD